MYSLSRPRDEISFQLCLLSGSASTKDALSFSETREMFDEISIVAQACVIARHYASCAHRSTVQYCTGSRPMHSVWKIGGEYVWSVDGDEMAAKRPRCESLGIGDDVFSFWPTWSVLFRPESCETHFKSLTSFRSLLFLISAPLLNRVWAASSSMRIPNPWSRVSSTT